jgi:hypothetical protein
MEVLSFTKNMLLMMMMSAMMWNMAKSEEHFVGGNNHSWVVGNNFTNWSLNQHFHLNDWLCKFSSLISFFFNIYFLCILLFMFIARKLISLCIV